MAQLKIRTSDKTSTDLIRSARVLEHFRKY